MQQAVLQPEMAKPETAAMTGTREEAEEGDSRPDVVAELLRFTIPELKVAFADQAQIDFRVQVRVGRTAQSDSTDGFPRTGEVHV